MSYNIYLLEIPIGRPGTDFPSELCANFAYHIDRHRKL